MKSQDNPALMYRTMTLCKTWRKHYKELYPNINLLFTHYVPLGSVQVDHPILSGRSTGVVVVVIPVEHLAIDPKSTALGRLIESDDCKETAPLKTSNKKVDTYSELN